MKHRQILSLGMSLLLLSASVLPVFGAVPEDSQGHWAENTIDTWMTKGYISGYPDGSFQPDKSITRAEFVVLANKVYGFTTPKEIAFTDVPTSHWAYVPIQKGVAAGYIHGDDAATFRPDDRVTRAEAASMLARLQNLSLNQAETGQYTDDADIPAWAKTAVTAVSQAGIMKGFPDGSFHPQDNITRAETITALSVALGWIDTTPAAPSEDVTLTATSLQNKTIKGNLILPASLEDQKIVLEHITVEGKIVVSGGSTIQLTNCDVNSIQMNRSTAVIDADVTSNIDTVTFSAGGRLNGSGYKTVSLTTTASPSVVIDADVDALQVDTPCAVKLYPNADVSYIEISEAGKGASFAFSQNAVVDDIVSYTEISITGRGGSIDTMTLYANGVSSDIYPEKVYFYGNANKITYTAGDEQKTNTTKDETAEKNLLLEVDGEGFNGLDKTYKSATIRGKDARLSNVTITNDVTIQDAVAKAGATLSNVTVNNDVNIYGGRDSITFENSTIQHDILSKKAGSRDYVTLYFDKNTLVKGDILIQGNTVLQGERGTTLDTVVIPQYSPSRKLEIDVNVKNLEVNSTAAEIQLNSSMQIENFQLSNVPNTLKLHMAEGSVIDVLYADANMEISGNGTIHKIVSDKNITLSDSITTGEITDSFVAITDMTGIPTTVDMGTRTTLSPVIRPSNASNQSVRWKLKDAGTTDAYLANGNVLTTPKTGTVVVTAEIKQGINDTTPFQKDFTIQVVDPLAYFVPVEDIQMTSPATWDINEPLVLQAAVTPSNATNQLVQWRIKNDNDTKATLYNNTLESAFQGTITVTAFIENGVDGKHDYEKDFKIQIIPMEERYIKVDSVEMTSPKTCSAGDVISLSAAISPTDATYQEVQWTIVNDGGTGAYIANHTELHTKRKGTIVVSLTIPRGQKTNEAFRTEFNIVVK